MQEQLLGQQGDKQELIFLAQLFFGSNFIIRRHHVPTAKGIT
jgi:hypothetical protein